MKNAPHFTFVPFFTYLALFRENCYDRRDIQGQYDINIWDEEAGKGHKWQYIGSTGSRKEAMPGNSV